jgi:hypothetical protein
VGPSLAVRWEEQWRRRPLLHTRMVQAVIYSELSPLSKSMSAKKGVAGLASLDYYLIKLINKRRFLASFN